jgi:hypothetical protein
MGLHLLNTRLLRFEVKMKQAQVRTEENDWEEVLSRLADLEVSDASRAMFQRFLNGELTTKELTTAIDEYLSQKSMPACENQRE